MATFAEQLAAMLWPERYPPGHELHDDDHVYWQGEPEPGESFQWSADTIEWVAIAVERELAREAAEEGQQPIERDRIVEALRDAHRNDSAADAVEFVSDLVGWSAEDDPELQAEAAAEEEERERATCSTCLARTYRGEECVCPDGGVAKGGGVTDFPAIKRVLEREHGLTITDYRAAWAEYEQAREAKDREWKRVQDAYGQNAREREELRRLQAEVKQ